MSVLSFPVSSTSASVMYPAFRTGSNEASLKPEKHPDEAAAVTAPARQPDVSTHAKVGKLFLDFMKGLQQLDFAKLPSVGVKANAQKNLHPLIVSITESMGQTFDSNTVIAELNHEAARILAFHNIDPDSLSKEKPLDSKLAEKNPIRINIASYGGDVAGGEAVIKTMRELKDKGFILETHVTRAAASMGSLLASEGSKGHRYIQPYSLFMIHCPRKLGQREISIARDSRIEAKRLENIEDRMIAYFLDNSDNKVPKDILEQKIRSGEDWYLEADEVIKYGLADHIEDGHDKKGLPWLKQYFEAFKRREELDKDPATSTYRVISM